MDTAFPSGIGVRVNSEGVVTRRAFLGGLAGGGLTLAGLGGLRAAAPQLRRQGKSCILLWMAGGPSQFETFDPKPGADTQGPTKSIATSVPGTRIAEHWPHVAGAMKELAVIRSMTSKEGNHGRATYLLHTSYPPSGGITHPGIGSQVAQELGRADSELPLFVEVQPSGWDTHGNELPTLKKLIPPVDRGTAALLADLKSRGLLGRTLVVWMGEFGRTPRVNLTAGRDHYPQAFNLALAGAGVRGGQVIGATDAHGAEVIERPVTVPDLFCTFCKALGIDPRFENQSNVGRPLKIVETGKAVGEVF